MCSCLFFTPLILTLFYSYLPRAGRVTNIQHFHLSDSHLFFLHKSDSAPRSSEYDPLPRNGTLTTQLRFLILGPQFSLQFVYVYLYIIYIYITYYICYIYIYTNIYKVPATILITTLWNHSHGRGENRSWPVVPQHFCFKKLKNKQTSKNNKRNKQTKNSRPCCQPRWCLIVLLHQVWRETYCEWQQFAL